MNWNRVVKTLLVLLVLVSVGIEPSARIYADQTLNKQPLIYAGGKFSGVVNSDGSVWSWGDNGSVVMQQNNRGRKLGRGATESEVNPLPKLASLVTVKPVQI
ncbi:hypothetical protein FY526_30460, partial [Clostridioides difficile]